MAAPVEAPAAPSRSRGLAAAAQAAAPTAAPAAARAAPTVSRTAPIDDPLAYGQPPMEQPGLGEKGKAATRAGLNAAIGLSPIGPLNTIASMFGYGIGNLMTDKGMPAMPTQVMGPSTSDQPGRSEPRFSSAAEAPVVGKPRKSANRDMSDNADVSYQSAPLYSFQHLPRVDEEFLGRNRQTYYEDMVNDPEASPTMRAWAKRMSQSAYARGGIVKSPDPSGVLSRVAALPSSSAQLASSPFGALKRSMNG
jgi:hypothetical protein